MPKKQMRFGWTAPSLRADLLDSGHFLTEQLIGGFSDQRAECRRPGRVTADQIVVVVIQNVGVLMPATAREAQRKYGDPAADQTEKMSALHGESFHRSLTMRHAHRARQNKRSGVGKFVSRRDRRATAGGKERNCTPERKSRRDRFSQP